MFAGWTRCGEIVAVEIFGLNWLVRMKYSLRGICDEEIESSLLKIWLVRTESF